MDAAKLIRNALDGSRASLDEQAGKQVLSQAGVSVPKSVVVTGPMELPGAIEGLSAPFVVKVMSAEILHKSDAGGVAINLQTTEEVATAVAAMATSPKIKAAKVEGYLIEEMAPAGQEVVIGGLRDPNFGPMVMVGLGGIFVEVLKDVSFRVCPITEDDARRMLDELKGGALLDGARGQAPASRDAIVDVLIKLGGANGILMTHADTVAEVDINPLIVSETAAVAADARFILVEREGAAEWEAAPNLDPLFMPKTIAVAGASATSISMGNTFLRRLKEFGYQGTVYPIHPKAEEINGLKAYASFADTPEPIDYAYISIAAGRVPPMLAAAKGRVKFAQVLSSGFAEVPEGVALQEELVAASKEGGSRLIGPNCLGTYSPRGGVTFPERATNEPGVVGVISQSGGLATDIVRLGQRRGLRFSGLVTVGNCADLNEADVLEYYLNDEETRVIGLYLEDDKNARRIFELLSQNASKKPVVLLKGGRTQQGRAAAASHTGSLAGGDEGWVALSKQTGAVLVESLGSFLDVLLAFQFLTPNKTRPTKRIALFGNGGGTSVLATDSFARLGLDVARFEDKTRQALEALKLPPGTSVANPIDAPVGTLQTEEGRIAEKILDGVYAHSAPDAFVMHLNLTAFTGRGAPGDTLNNLVNGALRIQEKYPGQAHFVLVLRSDGEEDTEALKREFETKAAQVKMPVYGELIEAAGALAAVSHVERFLHGS
jgi:acyl-CoA synthetase (NDP forming)